MTTRKNEGPAQPRRLRGDQGAALLEFALVAILLFTLIYGIIAFGFMLSFRQDLTRAAAEGARAGAVAYPASSALAEATTATQEAVDGFGQACGADGMTCTVTETQVDCDGVSGGVQCDAVRVQLSYDYESHPLLPDLPFVSAFMPDTLEAESVARENT